DDYSHDLSKFDFVPIPSPDLSELVYVDTSDGKLFRLSPAAAVLQINLTTGERKVIGRNCVNAAYSGNAQYILLTSLKKGRYYIYSNREQKIVRQFKKLEDLKWE